MQGSEREVGDVMSEMLVCVDASTQVGRIHALARERGIHHFPVYGLGTVVGFVCTCDVEDTRPEVPVGTVMRELVVTVQKGASTAEAARVMALHSVGSAVVLDGELPCGIVTRADLVGLGEELEDMLGECRCASCGSLEHLKVGPNGFKLCLECRHRAVADEAVELGGGG